MSRRKRDPGRPRRMRPAQGQRSLQRHSCSWQRERLLRHRSARQPRWMSNESPTASSSWRSISGGLRGAGERSHDPG
eukprot:5098391-Pyramimonas_sp.AAC.1